MSPPFECVAVACRGEIALRIIRACRELGIAQPRAGRGRRARRRSPSARPTPRSRSPSYLDAATLAVTAAAGGAHALHPGYGFLSESPELAEACRAAGLVFVGPPARGARDARAQGRRARARAARGRARRARRRRRRPRSAIRCSSRRVPVAAGAACASCATPSELPAAVEAAAREAEAAFGDRGAALRALRRRRAARRGADPARRARRRPAPRASATARCSGATRR